MLRMFERWIMTAILLPFGMMSFSLLTNGKSYTDNALSTGFDNKSETFQSCDIKGNVSHNTGERIYHLPHQMYYDETVISSRRGERYFCSEEEAVAAGWRKSKV